MSESGQGLAGFDPASNEAEKSPSTEGMEKAATGPLTPLGEAQAALKAKEQELDQAKAQQSEMPPQIIVDDSHKYTTVFADDYIGPGGAHHFYTIRSKNNNGFCRLGFQDGPIKEAGVNGIMDENLLAILIDRLRGFQAGPYVCKENEVALSKLELALDILKERTRGREARGVEGTHQK